MGNKMKVIARKKRGFGILYMVCGLFLSFVSVKCMEAQPNYWLVLACFAIVALCVYGFIDYILLPEDVILLSEKTLYLPRGVTVALVDVTDVSYMNTSKDQYINHWGYVTIKTKDAKYKYNYIEHCMAVADRLTDMVKRAKSGDIK